MQENRSYISRSLNAVLAKHSRTNTWVKIRTKKNGLNIKNATFLQHLQQNDKT